MTRFRKDGWAVLEQVRSKKGGRPQREQAVMEASLQPRMFPTQAAAQTWADAQPRITILYYCRYRVVPMQAQWTL